MRLDDAYAMGSALADRSRLTILHALTRGPQCVEELARTVGLADSTVSFHLKKLRAAGLVTSRRDQYYTVYETASDALGLTLADLVALEDLPVAALEERVDRERVKVVATFFAADGLVRMPVQKRKRDIVLEEFAGLFEFDADHSEAQVDAAITALKGDHCLVRRLLVDEGYLTRTAGVYRRTDKPVRESVRGCGVQRTRKDSETVAEADRTPSDSRARRAELRRAYKEREKRAGVFQVRNTANGRVLLGSALDLHAPLNRVAFELEQKVDWNRELRHDLDTYGRDSFVIEVLETVESKDDPDFDPEEELERLEQKYLATLDLSTAYNRDERIRYP